jgi:uncharacterized delta-60 repeat protein
MSRKSMLSCAGCALALLLSSVAPASAQKITVKAATPNNGPQGSVNLDILIDGSGFGADSQAQFHVSGTTNPGGIRVNRTTRLSNAQLRANIDIDDVALLSYYDVKVVSNGRTGKGTDLFQVIQKGGQAGCEASVFRVSPVILQLPSARASLTCGAAGIDCAFAVDGLSMRTLNDYALVMDMAVDANGRIVVLAESHPPDATTGFYVLRYSAAGAVDSGFGTNGVAHVAFTSGLGNELPQKLAVQPDGAIIVVGSVPTRASSGSPRLAAVARFLSNGVLDGTFGTGGRMTFSFGSSRTSSWAFDVAIQSDGRLVVGGTADNDFAAARLLANGTFDSSFATGGKALVPMGSGGSGSLGPRVGDIVFQNLNGEEAIVLAGDVIHCTLKQIAAVRLHANGSVDTTFGARGDGRVFVDVANGSERVFGAAVDSANRVILGGQANLNNYSAVVRLNADGRLDPTFGSAGAIRLRFDGLDTTIFNLTVDAADRVLATGGARFPGTMESDAFVVRLQSDGTFDAGFADNGALLFTYPVGNGDDQGGGIGIQSTGRVIVAGRAVFNHVVLLGLMP